MLKVCIIGCGGIGGYHLGHLTQYTDIVSLEGFCDIIPEKAEDFVKKAGSGKAYTCYKTMVEEIKPDAVFVCVPPYCHGEIENFLIDRHIHFFVEKPIVLDMEMGKQILSRIKEEKIITAVGFQCRYDMISDPLKEFTKKNEIVYINCTRFGGIPDAPWWSDKKISGGQLVEQTIHQLDYIRYTYGEPDTVFSMASRGFIREVEDFDTDDISVTVVRFKSGALATVATGCYSTSGDAYDSKTTYSARDKRLDMYLLNKIDIFGDVIEEETAEVGDLVIKGDGGFSAKSKEVKTYKHSGDSGLICDRTFLEAVISGDDSKIRSPYEDALKSVEFALACNKSMETGLPVKIGE